MKRRTRSAQLVEPKIVGYDTSRLDKIDGHMSDYDGYTDDARQLPSRQPRQTFVPAAPVRRRVDAPTATIQHTIDVPLSSTQWVEVRTSATDRAKGHAISTIPLLAAFAVLVVIVRTVATGAPIMTLATLSWFWTVFVLAWLISYLVMLMMSAEGVTLVESVFKWMVISREQKYRWHYYDRLAGDE
jgi:hypothetical protein